MHRPRPALMSAGPSSLIVVGARHHSPGEDLARRALNDEAIASITLHSWCPTFVLAARRIGGALRVPAALDPNGVCSLVVRFSDRNCLHCGSATLRSIRSGPGADAAVAGRCHPCRPARPGGAWMKSLFDADDVRPGRPVWTTTELLRIVIVA